MRLVACLIARNEERDLARCLSSLSGAVDGICLLDTGSSDRTAEVARSFGAVLGSLPWDDDFSVSRNACLELAEGDWILQVDADEELDRSCIPALRSALDEPGSCRLVEVSLLDGSDRPGKVLLPRLFRLDPRIRYRRALHESVLESLAEAGLPDPTPVAVRLVHHGYAPDAMAEKSKRDRNVRILRKVRDRGAADTYDLYKLGTTLAPWGEDAPERSLSLEQAWRSSLESPAELRAQWPWWPSLARSTALDRMFQGRFQEAWNVLETSREAGDRPSLEGARAELLLRAGFPLDASAAAEKALSLPAGPALAAFDGRERGHLLHLASRCARASGRDPKALLQEASSVGQLDARCDLVLLRIGQGDLGAWNDLDRILRSSPGNPVALIAASEAARSQGDRSTSDLLLERAAAVPSEAGQRARARLWMRAWLDGKTPPFELPAWDVENAAAQALDRIFRGGGWKPDPFLSAPALRSALADILDAVLAAGHEAVVRTFAENAKGRDGDLPGVSALVLGA